MCKIFSIILFIHKNVSFLEITKEIVQCLLKIKKKTKHTKTIIL